MKRNSVGQIEFAPSRFWCLHVSVFTTTKTPYGTLVSPHQSQIELLYHELSQRFKTENVNATVASPANLESMRRRMFREPTVIEWLIQNSNLSPNDAATIIEAFPIPVAPLMSQNARNPMQFLGLAAAIARSPDVIVYSTSGMDPRGISLIHKYASEHYPDGCLIHISTRPIEDAPACTTFAKCVSVDVNNSRQCDT